MRAVVDTNVWVSALLNPDGGPAQVRRALQAEWFTLVTSEPLLVELVGVLGRPRFAKRFRLTPADAEDLLALLRERGELAAQTGGCGCVETRTTMS